MTVSQSGIHTHECPAFTRCLIDRHLVSLFAATMFLGASPTYGQNGSVGVAYPATGIKIDGDLSDWPKNATTYPVARVEYGDKLAGKDDLNAQFRVAYIVAEHALYVAVEVSDNSIVLDGPGVARWDAQDGCELFVNAAHAGSGSPVVQYVRYGNQSQVARTIGSYRADGESGRGADRDA